jgi:hypothetical protein
MVVLASSVLCAWIVSTTRWSRPAIALVIALAIADGIPAPFPLYRLPAPGRIEQQVASDPRGGAVLELPVGLLDGMGETGRFDSPALVSQMAHEHPLVGGYVSRIAPRIRAGYEQRPAISALMAMSRLPVGSGAGDDGRRSVVLPDDLGPALLADRIGYVIVNTNQVALTRQELEPRGLRFLMAEGPRELYRVGRD